MKATDAILVAGPTASGKSALAMRLAEERGGAIVNADSMQVYSVLRVLTARPTAADERAVPHRLYGHVDPREDHSVARWASDVATVLRELRAEGRLPVITGGTGLYFRALLDGLSQVPPIDPAVREAVRAALTEEGPAVLHAMLAGEDRDGAARLRPTDGQRIARALEVVRSTGRPLHEWQRAADVPILNRDACERHLVMPERALLHERIAARAARMLRGSGESAAADEVRALRRLRPPAAATARKALGVAAVERLIDGEIDGEEAERRLVVDTRRYAKRQMTWFRNQFDAGWTLRRLPGDGG